MDDTTVTPAASAAIAADAAVCRQADSAPGLREAVLSGRFVGASDRVLEDRLTAFLTAEDATAAELWFGAETSARLRVAPDALRGALDRDLAVIDTLLSEQLDAILHDVRLRKLEGSWRGLAWLADSVEGGNRIKIRILNAGWHEVCRDLERAIEFDQSHLFRKIYEDEFGTPGGEPLGLLIVDHDVRHRPGTESRTDDVSAIATLSGVAAAAFCPVILGASPALLEVDSFTELATVTDIAAPMRNADHARWRSLAARADMRFVAVVLPHVLARPPWQDDGTRTDAFRYREYSPTVNERVWMSAGYAFATVVARAFTNYAWPADVRGVETDRIGGGLVDGLSLEPFQTDTSQVWARSPVEIVWTDPQLRALLDAGLMPLSAIPYTYDLMFGAVRSLQTPQRYSGPTGPVADANARLSSQINSILCASRFAHCLKIMGRQMVGSFKTAEEIEHELQEWLTGYVNANIEASGDSRARYPLVAGRVNVNEIPARPGSFGCTVHLQPHYQLDDLAATFRLITSLGSR